MKTKKRLPLFFAILATLAIGFSAFKENSDLKVEKDISDVRDLKKIEESGAAQIWFKYKGAPNSPTDPNSYEPFPSGQSEADCDGDDGICAIHAFEDDLDPNVPRLDPTLDATLISNINTSASGGDPNDSYVLERP